jgi:hypothetical protein
LIVDWLYEYGKPLYDHHGGIKRYFDKHSRRALERAVGARVVSTLSAYLDCYSVTDASDDRLVTVGHLSARIRRL